MLGCDRRGKQSDGVGRSLLFSVFCVISLLPCMVMKPALNTQEFVGEVNTV